MALPARRSYAGAAEACTLTSNISNSATSFSITGTTTGWPSTATGPFYMVIDPGLSTEEKVLVGARTTGSLSSVTRGVDGTSAAAHDAGATCYPVLAAVDLNEANLLASTLTTKGDLLSTDGSDPTKVAVGSNNTRLVADSAQTSGIKWVADTQNTVIDAKGDLLVGTAADTIARLAVGTNDQILVAASGETTGLKWAALSGVGGAWTSYTPTWTAATTNPAIGNGTLIGKYVQIQKMVVAEITVIAGSTTTYGSGVYRFGLPVTAKAPLWGFAHVGSARMFDSSTGLLYVVAVGHFADSTTYVSAWTDGSTAAISATSPITFANLDEITIQICYEAA